MVVRVSYAGTCVETEIEVQLELPDWVEPASAVLWVTCLRRNEHEDQRTYDVLLHRQGTQEAEPGPAGEEE